jgi:hypothetical protein
MSYISLNPNERQSPSKGNASNDALKLHADKSTQIKQGMSPNEIAEVVSNHLIDVVKKQFEVAKQAFQQGK